MTIAGRIRETSYSEERPVTRVLYLEDDPTDRELVEEVLSRNAEKSFEVTWVPRLADALLTLKSRSFDIALVDMTVPDSVGLQTYLRLSDAAPGLPVVVLTGSTDMGQFDALLKAGAQDCLLKLHPLGQLLPRAIHYAIERHRIRDELNRRLAELAKSETRLRSLIDSNTDAVAIVDRNGKVRFGNKSVAAMFGASLDTFIGSEWTLRATPGAAVVVDVLRPDGSRGTAELKAIPIFWDNEDVTLFALRDVSELLEARARQAEISEQLRHAQRIDALGKLAAGIAHDLNNTLVPIRTLAPVLRRSRHLNEQEARGVELIIAAAKRASELVRQIVSFGRRDALVRETVRLDELVGEIMPMLQAAISVDVHIDLAVSPVPAILGNRGQLYQILLNFVTNAAQAIGSGPGTISVGVVTETGARGKARGVRLYVADTGCGMDELTRARIFEPYFTTKGKQQGSGLGLSVVKGIVAEHGGTISVESKPGSGTRFDVVFPAAGAQSHSGGRSR